MGLIEYARGGLGVTAISSRQTKPRAREPRGEQVAHRALLQANRPEPLQFGVGNSRVPSRVAYAGCVAPVELVPIPSMKEHDMAKNSNPIRIPISNVLLGNDYTGKLYVGSQRKEVNLLLDTGSSTLAVDHKSYDPRKDPAAKVTDLVQEVLYGDGSNWIGSVVQTDMTVSASGKAVDLPGVSVAVAYHESAQMFAKVH